MGFKNTTLMQLITIGGALVLQGNSLGKLRQFQIESPLVDFQKDRDWEIPGNALNLKTVESSNKMTMAS